MVVFGAGGGFLTAGGRGGAENGDGVGSALGVAIVEVAADVGGKLYPSVGSALVVTSRPGASSDPLARVIAPAKPPHSNSPAAVMRPTVLNAVLAL